MKLQSLDCTYPWRPEPRSLKKTTRSCTTSNTIRPVYDSKENLPLRRLRRDRNDVVRHLSPKLLETLVDMVRTLDISRTAQRTSARTSWASSATRSRATWSCSRQRPPTTTPTSRCRLKTLDEKSGSNRELFTKAQLEKCQEEGGQADAKADTL
ncbi:Mediator of RNA polymerase II transcription subunit 10 [Phytophthora cinnamomi]|uniref:Mediator of RNA polymerase II transcription subunit 10 n=1 Tax=Phytophthora cinnamomi TaxID=4785 RepID=UPI003559AC84|nr:Mediator of RNA polymerase II transcription subunit 10 [Phytophthora cinnamomi]